MTEPVRWGRAPRGRDVPGLESAPIAPPPRPVFIARPAVPSAPAARQAPAPRQGRKAADASGLRALVGLAGLAAASAITTALLPSILPVADASSADANGAGNGPTTIQAAPGTVSGPAAATAPATRTPGATRAPSVAAPAPSVQVAPQPTPKVRIHSNTHQSGQP